MKKAARKGLRLRRQFGRGGLDTRQAHAQGVGSGVQRASNIVHSDDLPIQTWKRIKAYFDRHQSDRDAKGSSSRGFWGEDTNPSAGYVAWLLWGGDAGYERAKAVVLGASMTKNPFRILDNSEYRVGGLTFRLDGAGSTPAQKNWQYQGFAVTMKPSVFLKLAVQTDLYADHHLLAPADARDGETRMESMRRAMAEGLAFAPPYLRFTSTRSRGRTRWRTTGHEGRHRMESIRALVGDVPVPVIVEIRPEDREHRARHITDDHVKTLNEGAYPEQKKGAREVKGPLFGPVAIVDGREVAVPQRVTTKPSPEAKKRKARRAAKKAREAEIDELLDLLVGKYGNPRSLGERIDIGTGLASTMGFTTLETTTILGDTVYISVLFTDTQMVGMIETRFSDDCNDAFVVAASGIAKDWQGTGLGVLLYSLALYDLEYMAPDRFSVSPEAKRIWSRMRDQVGIYQTNSIRDEDDMFGSDDECRLHYDATLDSTYTLTSGARKRLKPVHDLMDRTATKIMKTSGLSTATLKKRSDDLFSDVYI